MRGVATNGTTTMHEPWQSLEDDVETYAMPVTPGQERFWSLDQLQPGNPALNMPLMWQCNGDLDVAALTTAVERVVQRHESLRTTFSIVDGKLTELIHPVMPVVLPVNDLSTLAGDTKRLEADRLTREHAALRFDLATGPLLALRLLRLGPHSHTLLVTMHHIICDGISNGILWRDLLAYYGEAVGAGPADLPALPIQFADYAVWHDMWRIGPDHARSLQFWREHLGTGFTPLRVQHDADAPAALPDHLKESTGAIETLLVPPDVVARARKLCEAEGVTPNVFFFTAFLAWLSRTTGEQDLTVGYPVGNRGEDTENLIGLFMNIQPIRMLLEGTTTFRDLLGKVQRWTVETGEHQHFPFEDLVHDVTLGEGDSALQIPIFFLYQPSFMLSQRIAARETNLQVVPLRSESPGAVFEWMMAVIDRPEEGPRLQLEYNPQLYKATTIQRHLRTLVSIIDGAVAAPAELVNCLPLLSPSERTETLSRHIGPAIDFGPHESVHLAIQQRARRTPSRVALECAGESLTYAQLLLRASSIAWELQARGARPGDRIAICMARSADMLASLLGILLCGCAYVPLDARHPRERIVGALEDAGARLVLTDRELSLDTDAHLLCVSDIEDRPVEFKGLAASSQDLAYVIYTSGSTGKPKGVAITHGALRNLLLGVERTPGLVENDVLVAITTISFDIATLELLLPLMVGARVVLATDLEARTPSLLLPLLIKSRATVLQATPGAWRSLIDEGWTGTPALKVLCGGEALSRDLANRLLEYSAAVWNMYGPTETTIWSSATPVKRELWPPRIDCPLANTQFYMLDGNGEPLPAGMDGELCIGGAGLARGYWNRDDLTTEKFTPNPFGDGRLYRTGDSARLLEDGSIRLQGRIDFQVKVRGYRIELGEIEHVLQQHAAVKQAVVVQHVLPDSAESAGVTRMIAYVAAGEHADDRHAPALIRELEEAIAQALPEYMVPNVIVALPELPRLLNGKVDRKALPDVFQEADNRGVHAGSAEEHAFQRPRDFLERQLTDIWQTTLGIPRISIGASFFSLGVGSLAALRLVTKMNRIFAMDLGLATLISASTIADIAQLIRDRHDAGTAHAVVPIRKEGSKPPLFILHGVGGNIINFIGLSRRLPEDRPVYAIQAQSLLAGQSALLRMEDMAAFYIREMKMVQPHGPYYLLGYSFGGTVAAEMSHQLRAAGEEIGLLSMLDARTRDFQDEFRSSMTVSTKVDRRMRQFVGNTQSLSWRDRTGYIVRKISTRGVRQLSRVITSLGFRHLPSALKSAYDVNYVAMKRYAPKQYKGRLVLFRATEQDYASGPRDMGWHKLFAEGVDIHEIPGDHERIFLEPAVDDLAKAIGSTLDRQTA